MPRLAQLLTSNDLLTSMLRDGTLRALPVRNHLPDDAVLFGVYNAHPGLTGLIFESASFPETPAGHDPAWLPLLPEIHFRAAPPAGLPSEN